MRFLLLLTIALFTGTYQLSAQTRELALKVNDTFTFKIGGVPSDEAAMMNQAYTIRENGTIKLAYLAELQAAGMKPSELARRIEQLYISGEIYTSPSVNITIDAGPETDRVIYVTGEVKGATGAVQYRSGITAYQAIGMAGGPTPFGKLSKVSFVRKTDSGQLFTRTLDLRTSNSPDARLELIPGDQLTVPN
jgi:protein involved in polysaccharide export with SLBB domain